MDNNYYQPFFKSSQDIIMQMTGIAVELKGSHDSAANEIASYGVASIVNFSGKMRGRFMIDLEPKLALKIAEGVLGEPYGDIKDRMVIAAISELNNIIAGDANTQLNNSYSLGLRLVPPVVYSGTNIVVVTPKLSSMTFLCTSEYGNLKLDIGFQGEVM